MSAVTVFSERTSPRLIYILDWIFGEVLNSTYALTDSEDAIYHLPFFISYGKHFEQALNIPDGGLLWEQGIARRDVPTGYWRSIPTLFHYGCDAAIPFDFFSAVFFLLSRHEEYYTYTPDKHNRYPVTESILYRNGWLERPLVDEWLNELSLLLRNKSVRVSFAPFRFWPTYDIDIAFSYKHKGIGRTAGAFAKSAFQLDLTSIKERLATLAGKENDPFDCFDWLQQLHKKSFIRPLYFVLASLHTTAYDKNVNPLHPKMRQLIKQFRREGEVGLHPSYYSTDKELFEREKKTLETVTDTQITWSRQHYIRLNIPETYYSLLENGVTDDWSMGYGSRSGFRAGTGRSFHWYDLKKEVKTQLRIHPFCFMDSTAHYEEQLSADAAFAKLNAMKEVLSRTNSTLVTVFHNFSLGRAPEWNGWNQHYAHFLTDNSTKISPAGAGL